MSGEGWGGEERAGPSRAVERFLAPFHSADLTPK